MRPRKNGIIALAALGSCAVAATLTPMLPVWLPETRDGGGAFRRPAVGLAGATEVPGAIVVDLHDTVSDADILDIERRTGIDLIYNSPHAEDDKLMRARVGDTQNVLAFLRADSRVEAAEPEQILTIPEPSSQLANQSQMRRTIELGVRASNGRVFYVTPGADDANGRHVYHWNGPFDAPTSVKVDVQEAAPQVDAPSRPDAVSSPRSSTAGEDTRWGLSAFNSGFRPNDPRYGEQWNFRMIGAEEAWKKTRGKGVVVAVIDTGVAAESTKRGAQCRDFGATAFTKGYDFVHNDRDPFDDHGHGTHVAGTIAESTNNGEGVAGLAFEATIMPIKVLTAEGWGTSSDIADAIRFAADNGANVINMSLGSPQASDVIHRAVKYARKKGVVIVCAAGNGFGEPVGYPAAFPECIAISSVGPSGDIATYSSYGKEVALAAPGGDMMQSGSPADGILQNTNFPESQGGKGDDYYAFQGTSMASPHAAAVAALVMSQGVTDPARVRDVLVKTATPKNDAKKYGAGILSAGEATKLAAAETGPKMRDLFFYGLGFLILTVGGRRRSLPTRAAMALALGAGFFGPDWFAARVGADSAWNLLTFSAVIPALLLLASGNGRGMKIAGSLALGVAVCLWANWHNNTIPFTTATFGGAAVPWTAANLAASFALANIAAWRSARRGS